MHDYECLGLNVIGVDASEKFFSELEGVTEPERKRKIIGKGFIDVFDEEAHKLKDVKWLAQVRFIRTVSSRFLSPVLLSRVTTMWRTS